MAAGDISDILVARVRTFLDEASAGFYTNDEIFASLSDAQGEIVSELLGMWKQKQSANFDEPLPEVLTPFITVASINHGAAKTYALPTDYLQYISVADNNGLPILIRRQSLGKTVAKANTYLAAATGADYCSFGSSILTENTDSTSISLTYVKTPPLMTTDIDPLFTSKACQNVMLQYAFADLLKKDEKYSESAQEFQKFMAMLPALYI